MSVHPFEQVVAHAQRVGHDRQRRVHRAARREEAAVDDVEVVEIVGLAVGIERRRLRVVAEADRAVLMRHAASGMRWPTKRLRENSP